MLIFRAFSSSKLPYLPIRVTRKHGLPLVCDNKKTSERTKQSRLSSVSSPSMNRIDPHTLRSP